MDPLRKAILDSRKSAKDDDAFIASLNDLISLYGDSVCPVIFNTLTTLDLPLEVAVAYWGKVQEHRKLLSEQLGRTINLVTALSDFLDCSPKYLPFSRLVDSRTYERVVLETTHDNLTGLFNRPYFDETYEQQISFANRYETDLSVLFLDIDDFKEVNDNMSHAAGDAALKKVAKVIAHTKRECDIAARYGGEEFVLLMPLTNNNNAYILAERIRKEIERTEIHYGDAKFRLTISGGLATYPLNSRDPRDLLQMADSAVYLAKGAGKNTISHFTQEQRRYLRMKMRQPVLVQEFGFSDNRVFSGFSKNICMGGVLIETDHALPSGTIVKLSLPISTGSPLLLIGKIVRVTRSPRNGYDMGIAISFQEMAKTANNEISDFLRKTNASTQAHSLAPEH